MARRGAAAAALQLALAAALPGWSAGEEVQPRYGEGLQLLPSGGARVRVYAPPASLVCVSGDWNGWAGCGQGADVLVAEGGGWWSTTLTPRRGLGAGAEYKLVVRQANGNQIWKPDPWARFMRPESLGNSIAYDDGAFKWTDAGWTMPSWEKLVIYELHVGTFCRDSASSTPGTLLDCVRFLDYLTDLGVNAVQLLPVAEFDGSVDMGYTSAYMYAVESSYGGPDALKSFVDRCHSRGIAVIMDIVWNHWGPMNLALWQFDGWHDEADLGGTWFYNDEERARTPWGHTRPNYGWQHVRDYIRESALFWLDTMHCDGLRADGVSFIRYYGGDISRRGAIYNPDGASMLREINTAVRKLSRPRLLIAEELMSNASATGPISGGGLGFDSQWDATFRFVVRQVASNTQDNGATAVRGALQRSLGGGLRRVVYSESHDDASPRLPSQAAPMDPTSWAAKKASALGAVLTFTAPGIPMIFQGQEFLETAAFDAGKPLDWARLAQHPGVGRLYRDLVALRQNDAGRTGGLSGPHLDVFLANDTDGVVAFRRWAQAGVGDTVLVVINLAGAARNGYRVGLPAAGRWQLVLDSDDPRYGAPSSATSLALKVLQSEAVAAQGLAQSALVSLGARSAVVYAFATTASAPRADAALFP